LLINTTDTTMIGDFTDGIYSTLSFMGKKHVNPRPISVILDNNPRKGTCVEVIFKDLQTWYIDNENGRGVSVTTINGETVTDNEDIQAKLAEFIEV